MSEFRTVSILTMLTTWPCGKFEFSRNFRRSIFDFATVELRSRSLVTFEIRLPGFLAPMKRWRSEGRSSECFSVRRSINKIYLFTSYLYWSRFLVVVCIGGSVGVIVGGLYGVSVFCKKWDERNRGVYMGFLMKYWFFCVLELLVQYTVVVRILF